MTATVHAIDDRTNALRKLAGQPRVNWLRAEKVTDDRHNKRYCRTVEVSFSLPAEPDDRPTPYHLRGRNHPGGQLVERRVREAMGAPMGKNRFVPADPAISDVRNIGVFSTWPEEEFKPGLMFWYVVSVDLHAERPSKVVTEEQALAWAREHVLPAFTAGYAQALAEQREKVRRERVTEQANSLADQVGADIRQRAKAAVRYEQRLAGLKAELEAELDAQVAAYVGEDKLTKDAAESGYEWEPDAVVFASAHLRERCDTRDPFRGGHREWRVIDLYPTTDD